MSAAVAVAPAPVLSAWMDERLAHFEAVAQRRLPSAERMPQRLHAAMRYAVLDGGKRVRPLLAYAAGEALAPGAAGLDDVALAVEYVHAYSLVHDDLPCMDNDVLRRGKPTVHVAFDEATAMLAGDALQAEAFAVLAEAPVAPAVKLDLMGTLARAAGTAGMCGGQAIDLAAVGRSLGLSELEQMHRMKTGALLSASVRMGALAAGAQPAALEALARYAAAVGLAFQVVDDILDVSATSVELGKTAGKDEQQGKPTYVSLLGLEQARLHAEALRQQAHAALDELAAARPGSAGADGTAALRLRQLADFIVLRKS